MKRALAAVAVLGSALTPPAAHAVNIGGGAEVIVASIDTGIRPTHQEFDYKGPSSTTDQIVAWWDFTDQKGPARKPNPGQTWDTRAPDPYDGFGHGTGTAAMAVGLNKDASKTKSFAPGFKLAVAKVGKDNGSVTGNIGDAVRWATDTVHADVITISIGSIVPIPPITAPFFGSEGDLAALKHARDAGALVVVSNGNGFGNLGLVTGQPGWAGNFAMSQSVLSVGANDANALLASTDPEVTAAYSVTTAAIGGDDRYAGSVGTSFGCPLVAGMAAKAMAIALANGRPATPDTIERLLKHSATDTVYPPNMEGYGKLDATSFATAATHAAAGTAPARSSSDPTVRYVEDFDETARDLWVNKLNREFLALDRDPGTTQGTVGTSVPSLLEGETYRVTLAPGESVTLKLSYVDPEPQRDIDLFLYSAGAVLSGQTLEKSSAHEGGVDEEITFTAPLGGTFTLLVAGWSVATTAEFTLSSVSTKPSTPEASFLGQDTYLNTAIPGF